MADGELLQAGWTTRWCPACKPPCVIGPGRHYLAETRVDPQPLVEIASRAATTDIGLSLVTTGDAVDRVLVGQVEVASAGEEIVP